MSQTYFFWGFFAIWLVNIVILIMLIIININLMTMGCIPIIPTSQIDKKCALICAKTQWKFYETLILLSVIGTKLNLWVFSCRLQSVGGVQGRVRLHLQVPHQMRTRSRQVGRDQMRSVWRPSWVQGRRLLQKSGQLHFCFDAEEVLIFCICMFIIQ